MEDNILEEKLVSLEGFREMLLELGKAMFEPKAAYIHQFDFFVVAVMDRSLSVIFGFTSLIRQNNFTAAAPLVRLHLDNLLRLYAAYISEDYENFSKEVMDGKQINKIKDRTGEPMYDGYLVNELTKSHPWIKDVYKQGSGYVHLSDTHIFNSTRIINDKGKCEFKISATDNWIDDDLKISAIDTMMKTSGIIYAYLEAWTVQKRNIFKENQNHENKPSLNISIDEE